MQPRLTLTAPIGGVVAELGAREGMTVMAGRDAVPHQRPGHGVGQRRDAGKPRRQVRPGKPVEARTPALPGEVFKGKVSAILPEVNPATRTLKARIEVANAGGRLKPGMFATRRFHAGGAEARSLLVPTEAVIQTGKRAAS